MSKKIMFNDLYGLTQAVIEGRKTMTRRIVPIGLYNQTDWKAVAEGNYESMVDGEDYYHDIRSCGNYHIGDIVAVAQAYKDIDEYNPKSYEDVALDCGVITSSSHPYSFLRESAGWSNKMFVRAKYMPIKIRITDIKVERLQDISDEDCLKEGIEKDYAEGSALYWWPVPHEGISWEEYKKRNYELTRHEFNGVPGSYFWSTPQEAFAALIDKVSGKGTWKTNPWVYVYEFELVK